MRSPEMFAYVCLGTNDLRCAARFYDATMAALGLGRCDVSGEPGWEGWLGWGTYEGHGAEELALWVCPPFNDRPAGVGNGTMVALKAKSWEQVDAFHAAALLNGGTSEGSSSTWVWALTFRPTARLKAATATLSASSVRSCARRAWAS